MRRALTASECIATIAVVLQRAGAATPTVGGNIGFRVHGEGGGDWIVDLGQPGGAWSRPADPDAIAACSVTLYAEADALARLVIDPSNVDTDLRSGTLAVDGDARRLKLLGRLLSISGSALNIRLPRAGAPSPSASLPRSTRSSASPAPSGQESSTHSSAEGRGIPRGRP